MKHQGEFAFPGPDVLAEMEYEGRTFRGLHAVGGDFSEKAFSDCEFVECDFTEAKLGSTCFEGCRFISCNFSNSMIDRSRFIDPEFSGCKLLGLNFFRCDQTVFDLAFRECRLGTCNFTGLSLKRSAFIACELVDCSFQEAYLVEANFSKSTFKGTLFHNTDLSRANFVGAHGYNLDPRTNKLGKARFSIPDVLSLLNGFDIVIKED